MATGLRGSVDAVAYFAPAAASLAAGAGAEEDVAVGQHHVVVPEPGAAGPEGQERPLRVGGVLEEADRHAPVRAAQVGPDLLLVVPDHHRGLGDAGGLEAVEEPGEEAPPAQLDEPLGSLLGERRQPLAHARGQDEGPHGFFFPCAASSAASSSCLVLSFLISSPQLDCWMILLNWPR